MWERIRILEQSGLEGTLKIISGGIMARQPRGHKLGCNINYKTWFSAQKMANLKVKIWEFRLLCAHKVLHVVLKFVSLVRLSQ